ncbi:MAG: effector-associated domain EAD1-containing protein [Cyanobacteria bacterium P01_A01_bin.37]
MNWELSPEQQYQLVDALGDAFTNKQRLNYMLRRECGVSLNSIASNAEIHEILVDEVVEFFLSHGKIAELVWGALRRNPQNPSMQKIISDRRVDLFKKVGLRDQDCEFFLTATDAITDFEDTVWPACYKTSRDFELYNPDIKEALLSKEKLRIEKWFSILECWLGRYGKNGKDQLYFAIFVQNLILMTTGATQAKLCHWLEQLPPDCEPSKSLSAHKYNISKTLDICFILVVSEQGITQQSSDFSVKGYLVIHGDGPPMAQTVPLSLDGLEATNQGALCCLNDIEAALPEWILQAREEIEKKFAELSWFWQYDYELTIEFWLPFEHVTEAVDNWIIYGRPANHKKLDQSLGRQYRVVVRSSDRFDDFDALNDLNRNWRRYRHNKVEEFIHHFNCWQVFAQLKQRDCLGLIVGCDICQEEHLSEREDLFRWMLDEGVPLAIWSRQPQAEGLKEQMQELCYSKDSGKLKCISAELHKIRSKEYHTKPWSEHLAFLFDEPERLLELKSFLKSGRLGR